MARKVELIYDTEIKSNKIIGAVQIVIGAIVFLMGIGFLLSTAYGLHAMTAFVFLTGLFMVITGLHTRRR